MRTNQCQRAVCLKSRDAISVLVVILALYGLVGFSPATLRADEPDQQPAQERPREDQPSRPANPQPAANAQPPPQQPPTKPPATSPLSGAVQPSNTPRQPAPKDHIKQLLDQLDPSLLQLSGADLNVEVVNGQLVIVGNEQDVAAIEAIVRLLDESKKPKELRVVQVTQRDAKDIATALEQAVRDREKTRPAEDQSSIRAVASNIILISALPEDIDMIVDLVEQVDQVPDVLRDLKNQMLTFNVKYRKASEVATQLRDLFKSLREKAGATGAKGEIKVVANNVNNTILVIAPETERPKIQALIDTLDVEPNDVAGSRSELALFPLMHSKAKDLADTLDKLIKEEARNTGGGGGAGAAGTGSSPLEERTVSNFILRKVMPDGSIKELPPIDVTKEIRIIPDEGTESLIVGTVAKNIEPLGELIHLLDGVPLAADVDVKLFALQFADAQKVQDTLKSMFEEAKKLPQEPSVGDVGAIPATYPGQGLIYNVALSVDQRSNTLIASGRREQLQLIEKIVADIDKPANSLKFPLRMIPILHTDATRVSEMVRALFDKRVETAQAAQATGSALEREKVFLSADIGSNTLIVSASPDNLAEITNIVHQLDAEPGRWPEQIHIIQLQHLSATDLKKKIDDLWKRKSTLTGVHKLPDDAPVIAIDERTNTLVIAASPEDFAEIQRVVNALEAQPKASDTQIFKLNYADANSLADTLDKLFEGLAGQVEGFKKPTIIPDRRGNTLVVAGSADTIERVDFLLRRMDVEAGPTTAIFKVYPLRYGSASRIAARMQELFDKRKEGEDAKTTPVAIFAEETSNSIVTSASRDDHQTIVDLLGLLDRPSSIAKQFEIFPLKYGKATAIADKLKTLFEAKAGGQGGGTGRQDVIGAEADERTNSLIVWAAPSEMQNIGDIITKLDTSTPGPVMEVRVIQLKQALAEDFATLLMDTVIGQSGTGGGAEETAVILSIPVRKPDGTIEYKKMLRQDIKIKADKRTNSLMVMAPAESIEMLESMIHDFDRVRPIKSEVRLFPLINSDAESIVTKLNELFKTEGGTGGGGAEGVKSQLVFGDMPVDIDIASVGQELRFTADTRTNTLIAAGAEIDLRMVEELVRYLDAQEAEDRVVSVLQTNYVKNESIASAIKSFNDQEQQVLGETEDAESKRVKAERQVSVESLTSESGGGGSTGAGGGGGSSIILGTSRRKFDQTMAMIRELDRPEPQVIISVLIAEVTLNDSAELGVEIAGRDLDFSDSAVLGPNGVIQGPDFDWISGTDLGAAGLGLGGFNFTVTGEDFSFLLHAVQQDSRLEVLSRPVLLVRNGEEGKISIADDVPFVGQTQLNDTGSTQSTIEREEVGIILTATPHISPDGYVTIELKQEVSNFSGENVQLTEGVSSPIISKREVDTNVTVRDGETVVVGGLITSRESEAENKVPLFGDLPIIGQLGRSNFITTQKTELLMVLTVDIARTDQDLRKFSIEQRDKFVLPDSVRQSPLMEGLRIRPEDAGLGPAARESMTPSAPTMPNVPPPAHGNERDLHGPRPKTYGPVISRPPSASTAAAPAQSFGPKIQHSTETAETTARSKTVSAAEIQEIEAAATIEP